MPIESTIEDYDDEIQNCPQCGGLLRDDTLGGFIIKRCSADRRHGYFTVRYINSESFVEFYPGTP